MYSLCFRFGGGDPGVLKAMVAGGHLGMMVVGKSNKLFLLLNDQIKINNDVFALLPSSGFKASRFTLINWNLPSVQDILCITV